MQRPVLVTVSGYRSTFLASAPPFTSGEAIDRPAYVVRGVELR